MKRSCVVTGAASGIGQAIASAFIDAGYGTVAVDIEERGLDQTVARLSRHGRATACAGDVADPATHGRAADAAASLGSLDAWVNCAGYNVRGSVAELSVDELHRGTAVNLLSYFYGTGEAVRRFLAAPSSRRGAVVNISSVQSLLGFPGFAAYAMCKGGINALTMQVAAEYAGRGIRCNAIAPGLVATHMNEQLLLEAQDPDGLRRSWAELIPLGRWGRPEDVAAMTLFLADPERAGFITGQVIQVDGGATVLARGQPV
jgi:NAD(P)-dependent dehydrogenase (short-subunit alcohol dehydrogenase family)